MVGVETVSGRALAGTSGSVTLATGLVTGRFFSLSRLVQRRAHLPVDLRCYKVITI